MNFRYTIKELEKLKKMCEADKKAHKEYLKNNK